VARIQGPGKKGIGEPPGEPNQDWVCLIRKSAAGG